MVNAEERNVKDESMAAGSSDPPASVLWLPPRVAVAAASPTEPLWARAGALAKELGIPVASELGAAFDLLLVLDRGGMALREGRAARSTGGRVVFRSPVRRSAGGGAARRRQPIARAVGMKRGAPSVVDATAGLGRDAWLLASLGCRVLAIERCRILAVMLRDALERAGREPGRASVIAARISLQTGDAREVLRALAANDRPDVVYLDPMFPAERKSALAKKELRMLRRLVGDDADAGELLGAARSVARERVVVKRLLRAAPLGASPTVSYKGKIARYDVYVTRASV